MQLDHEKDVVLLWLGEIGVKEFSCVKKGFPRDFSTLAYRQKGSMERKVDVLQLDVSVLHQHPMQSIEDLSRSWLEYGLIHCMIVKFRIRAVLSGSASRDLSHPCTVHGAAIAITESSPFCTSLV